MILELIKITNNVKVFVTRICDDCNKKERTRLATIFKGRIKRSKNIDLCRKCACAARNKSKNAWPSGEHSHLWKGGRRESESGIRIYAGTKGKYLYEHRYIMSQALQRELTSDEVVHHIDMDSHNNNLSNLFLFDNVSKHDFCHYSAEELGFTLFGKHIWFDRQGEKYTTKLIHDKFDVKVNLQFLKGKRIRIFCRRRKNGEFACCQYYNEKKVNGNGYYKRYLHIQIMQKIIKRNLFRNECVHHINGNSLDNRPENLIVLTSSRHGWVHRYSLQQSVIQLYKQGIVIFNNGIYKLVD